MTVLEELESAIQTAAERTGPKVIGLGQGWGRGSGFVVGQGRILTNAHNLRGDEVTVTFHDGRRETGRVLASDQDLDLAVIEADTADIEPIEWAEDARTLRCRSDARSSPSPIPGVAGSGSRPGSCHRPRAASAAPAGGGSAARSSTPRRCRADRPAVR